jgi:hypothetical protein
VTESRGWSWPASLEETAAFRIPATPLKICGFSTCVYQKSGALGPLRMVAAPTPLPRPQSSARTNNSRGIDLRTRCVHLAAQSTFGCQACTRRRWPSSLSAGVAVPHSSHSGTSEAPPTVGDASTRACLPTFPARAADQTHDAYMPDTARPVNGHPPGSSQGSPDSPWF